MDVLGYRLEARAGQGAMGDVWRASHLATGLVVAVKLVAVDRSPLASVLFASEVRAAATLDHPAIVRVLDQGRTPDGRDWLAFEWCGGGTLADRPDLRWDELLGATRDVLKGLAHAHARGVLHRDVKPANILYEEGWKLGDFGVARVGVEGSRRIVGTPAYIPPEQAKGLSGDQGPWSDLYSVGCMVWHLVTGAPPFFGDPRRILHAHVHEALPALLPRMDVPAGMGDWLGWLLAKRPEHRPAFAAHALEALEALGPASGRAVVRPRPARPTDVPDDAMTFVFEQEVPSADRVSGADEVAPLPLPARWDDGGERGGDPRLRDAGLGLLPHRVPPLVGRSHVVDALWAELHLVVQWSRPRVVLLEGPRGSGRTRLAQAVGWAGHRAGAARWAEADELERPVGADTVARWRRGCAAVVAVPADEEPDLVAHLRHIDQPILWIVLVDDPSAGLVRHADRRLRIAPLERVETRELVSSILPLAPEALAALVEEAGGRPGVAMSQLHAWHRADRLIRTEFGFAVRPVARGGSSDAVPLVLEILAVFRGSALLRDVQDAARAVGGSEIWDELEGLVAAGEVEVVEEEGEISVALADRTRGEALRMGVADGGRLPGLARAVVSTMDADDLRRGRVLYDAREWSAAAPRLQQEAVLLQGRGEDARALVCRRLSVDAYERLADFADPDLWRCRADLARSLRELAHLDEAVTRFEAWSDQLGLAGPLGAASLYLEWAQLLRIRGDLDAAVRRMDLALVALRQVAEPPPDVLAYHLRVAGDVLLFAGRVERAMELLEEAAECVEDGTNEWGWTHCILGRAHLVSGDLERAYALLDRVCQVARDEPWMWLRGVANASAGEVAVGLGLLDEAEDHYRRAAIAYRGAARDEACILELNRAVLCLRRAAWDQAGAIARRLRHDPRVARLAVARLAVEQVAGVAAAGRGDWEAFRDHAEQLAELAASHPALADADFVAVGTLAVDLAREAGRSDALAQAERLRDEFAARIAGRREA